MARLSEEKIEQIRSSVDIVDVIGSYIPLSKRGKGYWGICPFHDDSNPSMSVSQELQIYKCFVCGAGGNVFTFLQNYLKIGYLEAVKMVAEMGGIPVDELNEAYTRPKVNDQLKPLYDMHEEALKIYHVMLSRRTGLRAREYLEKRHITDEVIEKFMIGYAPNEDTLLKGFGQLNFNKVDMERSGLIIEGTRQDYDRFKDRIMFPLWDSNGQVVGFSGRIYQKDRDEAKYMNSPESEIFIKGQTLYHYHEAKQATRQAGFIYLLEGFMDVIALYRAGLENAVALMGTALTQDHLRLLRKLTVQVHVCLDGDRAGQEATLKNASILARNGFQVRVIRLKDGMDPDETLEQYGKEGLLKSLASHMSLLEFKINYYYETSQMDNYDERKAYLDHLAGDLASLEDPIDQSYYIGLVSNKSGFSTDIIHEKIANIGGSMRKKIHEVPIVSHTKQGPLPSKYQKAEQCLLHYMLLSKQVSSQYEKKLGYMYDATYRVIANYIVDYYRSHDTLQIADFINVLGQDSLISAVLEIAQLHLPSEVDGKEIQDYIQTISQHTFRLEIEDREKEMHQEMDPVRKAEILKEIIALKKKLNELKGVI
ncbi:DNA primase [Clostridiales bacterium CHKCI006]|uniref:DNA primase n=1 Tax=Candidatus Fimiplasma intestinipullorum TaxID=2840825 RepID=A0A9D1HPN2_9FIRM|nr:DNA primase [Clostridiales bacterium CHKCI006]HIU14408.1 DNA primase [Candidatus Fimiplasma intestinipullorum]